MARVRAVAAGSPAAAAGLQPGDDESAASISFVWHGYVHQTLAYGVSTWLMSWLIFDDSDGE